MVGSWHGVSRPFYGTGTLQADSLCTIPCFRMNHGPWWPISDEKLFLLVLKSQLVSGFKHFGPSLLLTVEIQTFEGLSIMMYHVHDVFLLESHCVLPHVAMIPFKISLIETTRGSSRHHGADARTSKAVRRTCHDNSWLVVTGCHVLFSHILGISSSRLTNSYF